MSAAAPPPAEADASEHAGAWVLSVEEPRRMKRAVRAIRRDVGVDSAIAIGRATVCVQLAAPPSPRLGRRVARRIGGPTELRLDCDVAWAPAGRGFVLLTVAQPAPSLAAVLDGEAMAFRDVAWPTDATQPVRVCLPRLALADPLALAEAWKAQGIGVTAVYEVGGCRRW